MCCYLLLGEKLRGAIFRNRSSHVYLNWLIMLLADLTLYGNEFFGVNGVVAKFGNGF